MPSILHVVAYTLKVRIPYRPVCIHLRALMVCKHTCSHHVQPGGLAVLHLHLVSNSVICNSASFAKACMHSKPVWDFVYFLQLDLQLLAYNNSRYEQKNQYTTAISQADHIAHMLQCTGFQGLVVWVICPCKRRDIRHTLHVLQLYHISHISI